MSYALDTPTLALAVDRWRQAPQVEPAPHVPVRGVSFAAALLRSGASAKAVASAIQQERVIRPPAARRAHEQARHTARLYTSKLLERDVVMIRRRARRGLGRGCSKTHMARLIQHDLRQTNLRVSVTTILGVISGDSWQGIA